MGHIVPFEAPADNWGRAVAGDARADGHLDRRGRPRRDRLALDYHAGRLMHGVGQDDDPARRTSRTSKQFADEDIRGVASWVGSLRAPG